MGILDEAKYQKFMDDDKTPRCQERVWHTMGNWGQSAQCCRAGKAEDDGVWHCKQHSNVEVRRRRKKKGEKYDKEWAAMRLRIHGPHFHGVLEQIANGHNDARELAREALDEFNGGG